MSNSDGSSRATVNQGHGILQKINLSMRIVLTAYGFTQFAIQVLWLGKVQMPLIMKSGKDSTAQRRKALYSAHRHVSIYLKTLSLLDLVKTKTSGAPESRPCIVVANHPSLLDFIVFLRDLPNAICLYKAQSLKNPVLSSFVQVAGYILGMDGTSGGSKRIVSQCQKRLDEGHHIAIFPEGTRSPGAKKVGKFRTTGFHAAVAGKVPVQPVAIHCTPLFLGKGQSWSSFCQHRNIMHIEYLDPIELGSLPESRRNAVGLAEAARDAITNALENSAEQVN